MMRLGRLWFGLFASMGLVPSTTTADDRIDFNRDVRPILSNNCILCHGPDEGERKADLRLDLREDALAAITPGNPDESELIARLAPDDPSMVMPPRKTGKTLSPREIDILTRWVEQGALYATHWAYQKPTRPEFPAVRRGEWPRSPIDRFLLARLEREGLAPSPEADRQAIARRVAIDLTGLPPSPEEVDAFLADASPGAYEAYVDRQLAKPSFGEHWGRLWLDLARYADSAGYADDPSRTIWAYRDWVIRAFNANMPFDRFTVEQLAGDLLPDPTDDQLIATAFHRNTMTNNEGGTDDEEFRNVAVIDRVNTTWSVWLGSSMACAQCHNHKYDPFSQADYFRSFAFLNNTEDADRTDESPVLALYTDAQKQRRAAIDAELARLEAVATTMTPELAAARDRWERAFPRELAWDILRPERTTARDGATFKTRDDGAIVAQAGKATDAYTLTIPVGPGPISALRLEAVTDPSLPGQGPGFGNNGNFVISQIRATITPREPKPTIGRFVRITLPGKGRMLSLAEVQVISDGKNIAVKGVASQSSTAHDGDAALAIDGNTNGDYHQALSTTHTATTDDPWWELDLKEAGPIERLTIWNRTDNKLGPRLDGAQVTILDDARNPAWSATLDPAPKVSVDLTTDGARPLTFAAALADYSQKAFSPAAVIASKPDRKMGWAVAGATGQPHTLTLTTSGSVVVEGPSLLSVTIEQDYEQGTHTLGAFRLSATGDTGAEAIARTPAPVLAAIRVEADERTPEQALVIERHFLTIALELQPTRDAIAAAKKELASLKPTTTVPICRDLPSEKRRETKIQLRGNWQALGDTVAEGTPEVLPPLPRDQPANRLALARWIVAPDNPLTARVIANRYWEQIFGIGLVRTSEEFGAQGEPPSHPELLDWLATELVGNGWDTKAFLKGLVTSAAYRQSSKVTPELVERDPDNRLLARGPRFRVGAEVVRDQALAAAGLLSPKLYGPSVNPPRPATGLNAAFGGAIDKAVSKGDDRYRRGLYTEWRRTNPYPSMTTFDAPNRDVCTVRRNRTNTPLQALVTLNDPVYIEAAQALARRIVGGATTDDDRARLGIRLALTRTATAAEVARIARLAAEARVEFAADPARAKAMATDPLGPAPEGTDEAELAAWTVAANVLLNLDEIFLKR